MASVKPHFIQTIYFTALPYWFNNTVQLDSVINRPGVGEYLHIKDQIRTAQ